MEIRRELEKIVVDNFDNDALFLVNIEISENKGPKKVRVLVDSDEGLSIDQCAALSRKIGQVIEEKELIENAFTLEVSSPGLDYPLKFRRQYLKNIGRRLRVLLNDDNEKTGELMRVEDDSIVVNAEQKAKSRKITCIETEINFSDIKKTNVLVSFK